MDGWGHQGHRTRDPDAWGVHKGWGLEEMVVGWGHQGHRTRDPDTWGVHGHVQHKGWGLEEMVEGWGHQGHRTRNPDTLGVQGHSTRDEDFRVTAYVKDGDFRATVQEMHFDWVIG